MKKTVIKLPACAVLLFLVLLQTGFAQTKTDRNRISRTMELSFKNELLKPWYPRSVDSPKNGDWYAGGLDKQPEMKTASKGQIWKGTYHNYRALANCIRQLKTGSLF